MRIYTIHLGPRPEADLGGGRDLVLVKEGFCWPAFFFTVFWALWHRLWVTAALLFVASGALGWAVERWMPGQAADGLVSLGFLVLVGLYANDWRRLALARRGFEEVGVVAGGGLEEAEHRAYDRLDPRLGAAA